MKQIQTEDELAGKTVAKIYKCFEELWMSFTDGTFALYRAESSYGDTTLEMVTEAPGLLENQTAAITIGLTTPEEIEQLHKEQVASRSLNQEKLEKEQLARLLAKYPQQ